MMAPNNDCDGLKDIHPAGHFIRYSQDRQNYDQRVRAPAFRGSCARNHGGIFYLARRCRFCGRRAGRYAVASRTLHDLGDPDSGRPVDLVVTYSKHCCPPCGRCFSVELSDLALPKCLYARRVQRMAVRLVAEDGLPYLAASWHLWRDHRVFVPYATIQNWVEAAGEKKDGQHLDHLP